MSRAPAFASLDLGTSRLRVGVWEPAAAAGEAGRLQVIADRPNEVRTGSGGRAVCSFAEQWDAVRALLTELGRWARGRGVEQLHVGLCGQVSSLLRWNAAADAPVEDEYPIWMDTTCQTAVPELQSFFGPGGAARLIGSALPPVASWLAVKARAHDRAQPGDTALVLQIQDAVFRWLTGACVSHPSSQISLVDQTTGAYLPPVLAFAGLNTQRLPQLQSRGLYDVQERWRREFDLPPTRLTPGLMDTYAAFSGLFPADGDGLLLTGTSEVLGVFETAARAEPPAQMVTLRLNDGWMIYGSSTSGGGSVAWLLRSMLGREPAPLADLAALSRAAAAIPPGAEGLTCLPYFNGERAPLWDSERAGALVGLRTQHGPGHLIRALFEGVAFARRQAAEALERPLPARFRIAGGSASNPLWNQIRAAVLGRPLEVLTCGDLALVGGLRHAMEAAQVDSAPLRGLLTATRVEPDPALAAAYAPLYAKFLALQETLSPCGGAAELKPSRSNPA